MHETAADQRWAKLDNARQGLLRRCERYAGLTLPYIFPPDGYDESSEALQLSMHSVGAFCVNNLANKIMLALFQPSFPFFQLDLPEEQMQQLLQIEGVTEAMIAENLANGERSAMRRMAKEPSLRPAVFELFKHLIITGNVALEMDEVVRVIGLRNFVVQRSKSGRMVEAIFRDTMQFQELDEEAREAAIANGLKVEDTDEVAHYQWVVLKGNRYRITQYVNDTYLGEDFDSQYKDEVELPFKVLTWVLPAGNHYAVSMVEEYHGDLAGIDNYAEELADLGELAAFWRILQNDGSGYPTEDFSKTRNGDVLPLSEGNVNVLQAQNAYGLQALSAEMSTLVSRIQRVFLIGFSVTRDAERVTAQEIRYLAEELETTLGGVYTRQAGELQVYMANYLMDAGGVSIQGTDIEITIITGFEALSRQSEMGNLQLFVQDVISLSNLPPATQDWLKVGDIISAFAAGRNIDQTKYVRPAQEAEATRQQRQQQEMAAAQQQAQAEAAARGNNQQ